MPGRTVVVAQRIDFIDDSQRILRLTLLATYPLLLLVLAVIAWRVVGAALRPVESLRSTAERISGTGQDATAARARVARRGARPRGHPELHARPARGLPRTGSGRSSPTPPTSCAAR